MMITMTEMHHLMHTFYKQHQRLPNTILIPATEKAGNNDLAKIGQALCVNIFFAAIPQTKAAIL